VPAVSQWTKEKITMQLSRFAKTTAPEADLTGRYGKF
jgi:hypothetical protein